MYLRFRSDDAFFGKHTGQVLESNSISNSTSANATSKYDSATKKILYIVIVFLKWVFLIYFKINLRDL